MKLRNKKTGEIAELAFVWAKYDGKSFAEFADEWEDYEPPIPEIRGSKLCKIVRDWYKYHNTDTPIYCEDACTLSIGHGARIEFQHRVFRNLEQDYTYTITELCGEEE